MPKLPRMGVQIYSEIGPLKSVLVHEPGPEVDNMPPTLMEELLFDDIIDGETARREHRFFREALTTFGIETIDSQALLEEAFLAEPDELPGLIHLISERERHSEKTKAHLLQLDPPDLAKALVHGILAANKDITPDHQFDVLPLPNLLMARDAQVTVANSVVICSMKRSSRLRESYLSRFIFTHHPRFRTTQIIADLNHNPTPKGHPEFGSLSLEGGDIMILKEGIIVAGISARTMERSVDILAAAIKKQGKFKTLIIARMPARRAQMHLDTVMTRISEDEFLVYPPMLYSGFAETLAVCSVDLRRHEAHYFGRRESSLFDALKRSGLRCDLIPCGGNNMLQQAREQWTDGANALALAPGIITLYDRNRATIAELQQRGYRALTQADFNWSTGTFNDPPQPHEKIVVVLPSAELSRARGGPRCMSMPLVRAPI